MTQWLDAQPLHGEIVELAAGTGWWSPLLAGKGELSIYDAVPEPLDLARHRLVAHGLRAHIHVRDAWEEPDRQVDAVFCGFWLSHVPRARLDDFLRLVARWLKPGGTFAFIDSRADPESGAVDHPLAPMTSRCAAWQTVEFRIPKVFYSAAELEEALRRAGFVERRSLGPRASSCSAQPGCRANVSGSPADTPYRAASGGGPAQGWCSAGLTPLGQGSDPWHLPA